MSEHADQFEESDVESSSGDGDDESSERSGEGGDEPRDDQPWAKASSGDADDVSSD